jgi:hypothetical protein
VRRGGGRSALRTGSGQRQGVDVEARRRRGVEVGGTARYAGWIWSSSCCRLGRR